LANEYEGDSVHLYLKEIDEKMNINKAVWEAIYCYQNFGLLFPHISQNQYNKNWKNRRKIKLSPYEDELFEECTTYIETADGLRKYEITGTLLAESKLELEKYEGYVYVPVNQLLPLKTAIEVRYKNEDIINQWNFTLKSY
jgi:hypothetical protein